MLLVRNHRSGSLGCWSDARGGVTGGWEDRRQPALGGRPEHLELLVPDEREQSSGSGEHEDGSLSCWGTDSPGYGRLPLPAARIPDGSPTWTGWAQPGTFVSRTAGWHDLAAGKSSALQPVGNPSHKHLGSSPSLSTEACRFPQFLEASVSCSNTAVRCAHYLRQAPPVP